MTARCTRGRPCYCYSGLLLDAVADAAARGWVLAAGDLNEARTCDEHNPGDTWGAEFSDAVRSRGLRDVTWEAWGAERRTRSKPGHPGYQLDFFLAMPEPADRAISAEVDGAWSEQAVAEKGYSDHAPVWLELGAGQTREGKGY